MEEQRFDEKLFSIAGDIIGEFHDAKRKYEEAEIKAEEAINTAKRLRQVAEDYMVDMIQKEEEKNIAIEKAVRSFQSSIDQTQNELIYSNDKQLNDKPDNILY